MSKHLLALSIGPVQGFIAAARRTRDLWCGSLILSEISKAAAKAVGEASGLLIFPALQKGDKELEPFPESDFNVANIILAEVPEGVVPADVATRAENAAQGRWKELAGEVKNEAEEFIEVGRWAQQVEDVIEFYASWCPLDPNNYAASRQRVMQIMAGRKACRTFRVEESCNRVPKSSLDGARDTLWKKDPEAVVTLNRKMERHLRLCRGEHLDAVGLTKRLAFGAVPYPSVSRISADPWLSGLIKDAERDRGIWEDFDTFANRCEELTGYGLGRVSKSIFPDFPYEGAVIYRNRHSEMKEELGQDEPVVSLINELTEMVTGLVKKRGIGEPDPYLAVLVADGDRMGKIISGIATPDAHRDFSRELAKFAGEARDIVERWNGCLVYSGGDDVLAFVPVDRCLTCAEQLHEKFSGLLAKTPEEVSPTLSVGIAIGHFMESLENLLEYGRKAEKAAKHPDRNGLAIHVHTRGGSPIELRGTWKVRGTGEAVAFIDRLNLWKAFHLEGRVSHGTAYDIRALALGYGGWSQDDRTFHAIHAELHRLLTRKCPRGQNALDENVIDQLLGFSSHATFRQGVESDAYHPEVMRLAKELLVARRIAIAEQQAGGAPTDRKRGNS